MSGGCRWGNWSACTVDCGKRAGYKYRTPDAANACSEQLNNFENITICAVDVPCDEGSATVGGIFWTLGMLTILAAAIYTAVTYFCEEADDGGTPAKPYEDADDGGAGRVVSEARVQNNRLSSLGGHMRAALSFGACIVRSFIGGLQALRRANSQHNLPSAAASAAGRQLTPSASAGRQDLQAPQARDTAATESNGPAAGGAASAGESKSAFSAPAATTAAAAPAVPRVEPPASRAQNEEAVSSKTLRTDVSWHKESVVIAIDGIATEEGVSKLAPVYDASIPPELIASAGTAAYESKLKVESSEGTYQDSSVETMDDRG